MFTTPFPVNEKKNCFNSLFVLSPDQKRYDRKVSVSRLPIQHNRLIAYGKFLFLLKKHGFLTWQMVAE